MIQTPFRFTAVGFDGRWHDVDILQFFELRGPQPLPRGGPQLTSVRMRSPQAAAQKLSVLPHFPVQGKMIGIPAESPPLAMPIRVSRLGEFFAAIVFLPQHSANKFGSALGL